MTSTNETRIAELHGDAEELRTLLGQASRRANKEFLQAQVDKLQLEVTRLQKSEQDRLARLNNVNATSNTVGYFKKIDTYGWDQSEKFIKIYVTGLKDLDKLKEGDVTCNYTERNFELVIRNVNNINYNLIVNNLLHKINPADSYFKVKSDMVTVFLRKVDTGRSWGYVTEKEAKLKDKAVPKMDENADPQEGLMTLMKKMYEEEIGRASCRERV